MAVNTKHKLLSNEETLELLNITKNGTAEEQADARDKLVEGNTRLVWHTVKRFRNSGYDLEDIFQIGCIGLLKAIDKFDPEFGVKLSTYGVPMIVGEIQRFIRDDGVIKVSRRIKEVANKMKQLDIVKEPVDYILENIGLQDITEEQVKTAIDYIRTCRVKSTDETVYENDGDPITVADQLAGDVNAGWFEDLALKEVLSSLNEKEMMIVQLRFFDDLTQSETGQKLGVSQVQASRLEKKVLAKLRGNYIETDPQIVENIRIEEEEKMAEYEKRKNNTGVGNREEAIKLLKETELTTVEIAEKTGVPKGSMGYLAKKHRPKEITERIVKKVTDKKRKKKPVEVKKPETVQVASPKSEPTSIEATGGVIVPSSVVTTKVAPVVEDGVGSTVVEFNFNLSMKGVAVDKTEVLDKLQEASNLLGSIETDKVSFRFNVGS